MLENIIQIDHDLFFLIHQEWKNGLFDSLMPLWRSKYFWLPLYLFLTAFIILNYRRKSWIILLGLGLTIALADGISSHLIKKNIMRPRPCHVDVDLLHHKVNPLVPCGTGYSFTSSHATNHFATAAFLSIFLASFFRWSVILLFGWAATIGYGQVYVGVHYPLDVIVGAIVGTLIGGIIATILYKKVFMPEAF